MTAEEFAQQTIDRYGLPENEAIYRAILEAAFVKGKIEGSSQFWERMKKDFTTPALRVVK